MRASIVPAYLGSCLALACAPTFEEPSVQRRALTGNLECGAVITADVVMTADLDCTGHAGTVLTIAASGIVLDGAGHQGRFGCAATAT